MFAESPPGSLDVVGRPLRSGRGAIVNLKARRPFILHYSFHILDPDWGHLTIKMAGHPPFGAQVILNGHEYVACQARKAGISFTKEGNCFTIGGPPTTSGNYAAKGWSAKFPTPADTAFRRKRPAPSRRW